MAGEEGGLAGRERDGAGLGRGLDGPGLVRVLQADRCLGRHVFRERPVVVQVAHQHARATAAGDEHRALDLRLEQGVELVVGEGMRQLVRRRAGRDQNGSLVAEDAHDAAIEGEHVAVAQRDLEIHQPCRPRLVLPGRDEARAGRARAGAFRQGREVLEPGIGRAGLGEIVHAGAQQRAQLALRTGNPLEPLLHHQALRMPI